MLLQHLNQVLDPEQSLLSARLVHCQAMYRVCSGIRISHQFHPNQMHKCFFKPRTMFLMIWASRIRRWPRPGSLNDTVGFPVETKRGHDERDGEILSGVARWILGSTISHGIVVQWIGRLERQWLPLKSNQSLVVRFLECFRTHFAFTQKQESTRLLASECQVRWRCEDSDSIFSLLLCFWR